MLYIPGVALPGAVVALEEVARVEAHVDLQTLLRLEALPALCYQNRFVHQISYSRVGV